MEDLVTAFNKSLGSKPKRSRARKISYTEQKETKPNNLYSFAKAKAKKKKTISFKSSMKKDPETGLYLMSNNNNDKKKAA